MAEPDTKRVVIATNVSPLASREQIQSLFTYIGEITQLEMYNSHKLDPLNINAAPPTKVCFMIYENPADAVVALQLHQTVFMDRQITVAITGVASIPSEEDAQKVAQLITALAPNGQATSQVSQTLQSTDATELQRTVYVENVPPATTSQEFLEFFQALGEVKYMRFAGSAKSRSALIEFSTVPGAENAILKSGTNYKDKQLTIAHSATAITKPEGFVNAETQSDVMYKIKDLEHLIGTFAARATSGSVIGPAAPLPSLSRALARSGGGNEPASVSGRAPSASSSVTKGGRTKDGDDHRRRDRRDDSQDSGGRHRSSHHHKSSRRRSSESASPSASSSHRRRRRSRSSSGGSGGRDRRRHRDDDHDRDRGRDRNDTRRGRDRRGGQEDGYDDYGRNHRDRYGRDNDRSSTTTDRRKRNDDDFMDEDRNAAEERRKRRQRDAAERSSSTRDYNTSSLSRDDKYYGRDSDRDRSSRRNAETNSDSRSNGRSRHRDDGGIIDDRYADESSRRKRDADGDVSSRHRRRKNDDDDDDDADEKSSRRSHRRDKDGVKADDVDVDLVADERKNIKRTSKTGSSTSKRDSNDSINNKKQSSSRDDRVERKGSATSTSKSDTKNDDGNVVAERRGSSAKKSSLHDIKEEPESDDTEEDNDDDDMYERSKKKRSRKDAQSLKLPKDDAAAVVGKTSSKSSRRHARQ